MTKILPYLWYPLFFTVSIAGFGALLAAGVSPASAAYPPIVATGLAIVLLEWKFPERTDWRPRWSDVKADAAFMAVVQIFLPRALAGIALIALAGWLHDPQAADVWPHHWPLAGQVLAMVLAVDFMRYWLHRACHSINALWRLHEVHHSPDILYTLNVGRFHPLEKVLHFSLDTIPFLVLGVTPEVIAGYFLVYSVNGFFQHSNVKLRYGFLNYLVGSAETHRWHHARDPRTAQCNFGNSVIIWDLLFGTWYLPRDDRALDIGITNRAYPKGFLVQMVTPFRRRDGAPTRTFARWLADTLIAMLLKAVRFVEGRRIAAALRNPMHAQRRVLARLLHENRETTFGRQYGFADIASWEDYRQRVPVSDFEVLRPYIEAEIETGERSLTRESPAQYVRTSGSTGKPKDIPMVGAHLLLLRRIHQTAVAYQHRVCPQAFAGSILAIVSPRHEGVLANGRPFGSASGIVSGNTPLLVREKFVLPQEVLAIADSRIKYLLILRIAAACPDITYIGSANPTTLLTLIKLYIEHQSALIDGVRHGTFFLDDRLTDDVRVAIRSRLRASPQRADQLAQLQQRGAPPRIADLWPALRGVMIWTCGSAGVAVAALRRELDFATRILELGYLSSEFRGTITLGRHSGGGLPTLHAHFFEFVERDCWDRGEPEFLTIDRLRKGVDYYIIVTTPSGLYRYFINDIVRVTGMLHRTPLLKFMQKGKGVTNITGEKLYEAQVLTAVRSAAAECGRAVRFVMMLAEEEARNYRLYVEVDSGLRPTADEFGAAVDARLLALNVEYAAKRESERLGPLRAAWLAPETSEAYKQFCVSEGQREGQFKPTALAYAREIKFDLDAYVEAA